MKIYDKSSPRANGEGWHNDVLTSSRRWDHILYIKRARRAARCAVRQYVRRL
jgi:hypothetical protein